MSQLYKIKIEEESAPWVRLAPILESLLPVQFSHRTSGNETTAVILEARQDAQIGSDHRAVPSLTAQKQSAPSAATLSEINVKFADDAEVPFPFRGRSLRTKIGGRVTPFSTAANEKLLACCENGPIWATSVENGVQHFRSAFGIPDMSESGTLLEVLNGERFLEMLPLLHFIRNICASKLYESPLLRACFMVDDPNLHWPRYGFVDFKQIAAQAAKENYHVSFATIPLDNWFTHRQTAGLFRSNPQYLSLLIHGNDHLRNELARDYSKSERIFLLSQAIQRIQNLEETAGIAVSRVMAAPHGACSEAMLAELPGCGFEAACISHGSLRAHNGGKTWTRSLGYLPSERIQGCPVLPRWGFSGDVQNRVLLAAYLKQPMIFLAHHEDLKNGTGLFDDLARFINGLGQVLWLNTTALSRVNYLSRLNGNLMQLNPLGHKINVQLPNNVEKIIINSSWSHPSDNWKVSISNGTTLNVSPESVFSLPESAGNSIQVEMTLESSAVGKTISCRPAARALLRRLLTEGRDRLCAF